MNAFLFLKSVLTRASARALALCLVIGLNLDGADLTDSYQWKPMNIGGGGWVVGMSVSPTEKDLVYIRTDVSGRLSVGREELSWKRIVTASTMPAAQVGYGKYSGVDSLVSAPKDPDIAYMAFAGKPYGVADGQIYRSTDRGDTWAPTHFLANKVRMEPNSEGRQEGERVAVDPLDSNVVYYASYADGLWITPDAGVTWKHIKDVPAGITPHGVNTVVFDSAGGDSEGKTKVIYVTVEEAGVFRTMDAGATWTKISDSGPGNSGHPRDAVIGTDGAYYVAFTNEKGASGAIWKCNLDGKWTNITPPKPDGGSLAYWDLAVDPTNAKRIVAICAGGKAFVSTDAGATWTAHGFHLNSSNVEWLGKQENYWLSVGDISFDPFDPGKLWFAEGFGVWWTKDLTTRDIEWHAASEGIEEACGNDIIAPPGGSPVGAMWDLGAFRFPDPDFYTAERSQPYFMAGWALDWCASDPKFIAGIFHNSLGFPPHIDSSGFSTDGGQTWTKFPALENKTLPADLKYGVIAVSADSPDHMVWSPAEKKLPYYTTDRGATWKQSSFDGATETGFDTFPSPQKPLCADRVQPNTFYFYIQTKGVYRSTDGGAHFTLVGCPALNGYNGFLKSVPGHGGDLWFADGTSGGLWHSTDGGTTWKEIGGIKPVRNFGLGAPEKEGGYPTLFAAACAEGKDGIFRSTDEGATWDKICTYPIGIFDWIDAMDGDKSVFGKVYICFAGSGFGLWRPAPSLILESLGLGSGGFSNDEFAAAQLNFHGLKLGYTALFKERKRPATKAAGLEEWRRRESNPRPRIRS